jgi:hypothetical protein
MGQIRNDYNSSIGKAEGKKLLRRLRHNWDDNIKTDLEDKF